MLHRRSTANLVQPRELQQLPQRAISQATSLHFRSSFIELHQQRATSHCVRRAYVWKRGSGWQVVWCHGRCQPIITFLRLPHVELAVPNCASREAVLCRATNGVRSVDRLVAMSSVAGAGNGAGAGGRTQRVVAKLQASVDRGDYYSALQLCQTLANRYAACRLDTLAHVLVSDYICTRVRWRLQ